MELHNVIVITKIKKKTDSKVFKNIKVGDEIYIGLSLTTTSEFLMLVYNRTTGEEDYVHINLVAKTLEENFEFKRGKI